MVPCQRPGPDGSTREFGRRCHREPLCRSLGWTRQFDDVTVVGSKFSFDDDESPTTATVEFEIHENGERQDLHVASFLMPGPFSLAEIDSDCCDYFRDHVT
jgi:hypothetical protein